MRPSLIPDLICPQCRSLIALTDLITEHLGKGDRDINQGELRCLHNDHKYQIVMGVPVMLAPDTHADQWQVADTFARKWDMVPDYGHESATRDFQREWYLQRFGWGTIDKLKEFLVGKERILDAGCGLGRDVRMYAENAYGTVFGVDISDGVFTAHEKIGQIRNIRFIKADMTKLPFPEDYFGFIACDQALHHTPDTKDSFMTLVRHLKPGGHIAVYVYSKKNVAREIADDLIRKYTTEMSHADCETFSAACARFGQAVSKLSLELQRDIYWNVFKCFWNDDYDFRTNVAVNLDWYRPKYAWRHTPEEVKEWCEEAHVTIEHFDVCESGISMVSKRNKRDYSPRLKSGASRD